MKYIFTAVLTPQESGHGYFARVPDLPGCITTGDSLQDAISQIQDAASGWLVVAEDEGLPIAEATPQPSLSVETGAVLSLLQIDTLAYRAATETRSVRKNVSLPAWMAGLADQYHINCSRLLQDALRKKLEIVSSTR